MRKFLVSTCLVATVACLVPGAARAQTEADTSPHKVGLIDMAEVFKNYEKFKTLTDGLKEEVQATSGKMQALQTQAQGKVKEMQDLKKDSPQYLALESDILKIQAQLQLLKTETQRDLARKEAQIYKMVYAEVQTAVAKYAAYYKYTLVIRYSSEQISEEDQPQVVIHKLNRLVVYSRPDDDITKSVVAYLNRRSAGGAAAGN